MQPCINNNPCTLELFKMKHFQLSRVPDLICLYKERQLAVSSIKMGPPFVSAALIKKWSFILVFK